MLDIEAMEAFHGDFQAVFGMDLQLAAGETLALIGANGAGKTSFLRAISGLTVSRAAKFTLEGRDMRALSAPERARLGVALCPEGRRMFPSLTVAENLLMGARIGRRGPWNMESVCALFPILREFANRPAALLSGGQQQMVAIGRALMANPSLLLLDEVSLGLAPVVVDQVHEALSQIRGEGMAVVLVEQDIGRALRLADRFLCVLEGKTQLTGQAKGADMLAIGRAYFGEDA
ncbi:ABC transporter ATP-binding protein [Thioclava sp. FR2]|uniref:ABC transporter ATP-binding protein n=1 Tax=Thioclava sp. FR2 TaxID=3445780 RepID=UPI003EBE90FA